PPHCAATLAMLSHELHANVHARPVGEAGEGLTLFDRTFEEVSEALAALPRMFIEPDGSFVWVSASESVWQLDGVLYDGPGRLWYIELKGHCPEPEFNLLLSALGWPRTQVEFQLVREAAILDEQAFRGHAGWL
ncbi:MAG: hypothetical protein ACREHD_33515, partial [Pirellulales bacterium]